MTVATDRYSIQNSTATELRARRLRKLQARTFTAVLVLPTAAFFILWVYFPAVEGLIFSFTDATLIAPPRFVGLANYAKVATDPIWWASLLRTGIYVVGVVVPTLAVGILFARIIVRMRRGKGLLMTLFFLPYVVPTVVSGLVFALLFQRYGLINSVLGTSFAWLQNARVAMVALCITTIWSLLGYYVVIFLAGYQQVPQEHLEAAQIDGANTVQVFRYVEIPALVPTLLFASISAVAAVLTDFTTPFILTNGGPDYATTTLPLYIYNQVFNYSSAGYGEAISTLFLIISLILTLFQVRLIAGRRGIQE